MMRHTPTQTYSDVQIAQEKQKKKQWKFCRNGSVASESKWH